MFLNDVGKIKQKKERNRIIMRNIEMKVYNFNELDKNIQEKLIEEEKDEQQNLYAECFLKNAMEEKAAELLQKYFGQKAKLVNVYYDLSYCQGSGAMIAFDLNYYNKDLEIKQCGHYNHERSFIIEGETTEKQEKKLKDKIVEMNEELVKYGYSLIEYEYSDEEIIEILNNYEYYSDGKIYVGEENNE